MDDERLAKEVSFHRSLRISEELTRLESHLAPVWTSFTQRRTSRSDAGIYRSGNFPRTQHSGRESRMTAEIAQRVVACKTELEKIREQVQNLE
jgi:uncharacterized protein YicC (UPF0701 family)